MGTGELSGQPDKNAGGVTCDGLASHPTSSCFMLWETKLSAGMISHQGLILEVALCLRFKRGSVPNLSYENEFDLHENVLFFARKVVQQ